MSGGVSLGEMVSSRNEPSGDVAYATEPIGVSTPIAPKTYLMWIVGLAAVVATVGFGIQRASGADRVAPGPDAAQIARMQVIDDLTARGDCVAVLDRIDDVLAGIGSPGTEEHSRDAAFVVYANNALRGVGCRPVEPQGDTGFFVGSGRSARH